MRVVHTWHRRDTEGVMGLLARGMPDGLLHSVLEGCSKGCLRIAELEDWEMLVQVG